MIITRLNDDDGKQAQKHHTFNRFQNRLFQELVKPEHHEKLREQLAQIRDIRNFISERLERLRNIRDRYIAHPDADYVYGISEPEEQIFLSDLQYLRDKLKEIFEVLSLRPSNQWLVVPLDYHDQVQYPKGTDSRPDIVRILDDIAHRSRLLNMPEEQPAHWEVHKENFSAHEIEQLNLYRQKFGLPLV